MEATATAAPAASTTVLACGTCGAELVIGNERTARCPYCDSPTVVERPASRDRPNPVFVLTFAEGDKLARRALTDWIRSQSIFADSRLRHAKVTDLKGIYVPGYLYSAVARSSYTAEIGENYTETETYTTKDANGNTVTRTRVVTKTEWRTLHGQYLSYATDIVVSASKGLPNLELERVEPFDLRLLRRYDPALISGWMTEEPSRTQEEVVAMARDEAAEIQGKKLRALMPGDRQGELTHSTVVEWETLDPVLVPVWVLAVRYRPDAPPLRVVVNGQTGAATGKAPLSWWKILIAVVLGIAFVVAIALFAMGGNR